MKNTILFTLVFLAISMFSCNNPQKVIVDAPINSKDSLQALSNGFLLLENNCFSCHSPNPSIENKVAPAIAEIKRSYKRQGITQRDFTTDLVTFLEDPSEENSKMKSAIKQFNLMPKMNFNQEQMKDIASYIYQTELENPEWFATQYPEEKQKYTSSSNDSPIEQGQSIAMKAKAILGKNLLSAINSKGTENAVSFCSTQAIPLTDSAAVASDALIKRVSDKNRNPKNKANEDELAYINLTKEILARGEKPMPKLTSKDGKQIGYYPIITNEMCLQCHGQKSTEILPATLTKINELYPNDKATGYLPNELRGIWVVELKK